LLERVREALPPFVVGNKEGESVRQRLSKQASYCLSIAVLIGWLPTIVVLTQF
jgi:hypothetical protein